jgi:hypothetical protein
MAVTDGKKTQKEFVRVTAFGGAPLVASPEAVEGQGVSFYAVTIKPAIWIGYFDFLLCFLHSFTQIEFCSGESLSLFTMNNDFSAP